MSGLKNPDAAVATRGGAPALVEFFRYFVASALALGFDFGVYVTAVEWAGLHYLAAAALGFSTGLTVAYALSIRWVFQTRAIAGKPSAEFAAFALIGVAGLGLNQLILYVGTGVLGADYRLSKAASAGLVFLFNFTARKLLLFASTVKNRCP